jgi:hypothetical protein
LNSHDFNALPEIHSPDSLALHESLLAVEVLTLVTDTAVVDKYGVE